MWIAREAKLLPGDDIDQTGSMPMLTLRRQRKRPAI
jgi:hypothetical protein